MVRLTDRPDMTLDVVYRGRKTKCNNNNKNIIIYRENLLPLFFMVGPPSAYC